MGDIQWKQSPVPVRKTGKGSLWDHTIPADLTRHMRLNPGVTFLLTGPDGAARDFSAADVGALVRGCPEPFRVQSRATGAGKDRHVWVSMDPGHWEALSKRRAKGDGKP